MPLVYRTARELFHLDLTKFQLCRPHGMDCGNFTLAHRPITWVARAFIQAHERVRVNLRTESGAENVDYDPDDIICLDENAA